MAFTDTFFANLPFTHDEVARPLQTWSSLYGRVIKRMGDLLIVICLLPTVLPVIGIMYFLTRLDGGAGFYGHRRIGKSGKAFTCWKIRTMVPDAQARLAALLESDPMSREEWERDCKLRHDPRVTRIGHFLRQSSLDELPQIWNVLRGDMSLVGPRPVTQDELARYGAGKSAYLALRPGITGLWQVSGRNDVSYEERVKFDVAYREKLSWQSDLQIMLRTVGVVLNKNGL